MFGLYGLFIGGRLYLFVSAGGSDIGGEIGFIAEAVGSFDVGGFFSSVTGEPTKSSTLSIASGVVLDSGGDTGSTAVTGTVKGSSVIFVLVDFVAVL